VPRAGRLFIGINQAASDRGTGGFAAKVEITPGAGATEEYTGPLPKVTQEMLDKIPRRVQDAEGTQGDRVNFLIVGTEDQVKQTLLNAGWVVVDKSVKDTLMRGAIATFSKQAYVTLPMSELQVFGRSQDYGFAKGDPVQVVAARHHFRIWKAPFDVEGATLWIGAGTHDVGFDRDQRNGKITHKIDSDTDKERDFIGESMSETGAVAKLDYMTATDPIKKAKTAHGQEFYSDGRTLIIYMKPDRSDYTSRFSDVFCTVLARENPDGGEWGPCSRYLDVPGKDDLTLGPIANTYRVLIVPGIFSSCASKAPAFMEGQQHLKEKYGLAVELLQVPNDSSEDNARMIAEHLKEQMKSDPRKYIVLGYSKGAPDVQTALALQPGIRDAVAAFVSVAGASGGSPIADVMPGMVDKWVSQFRMGDCRGDLSTGMRSLQRSVRQAFLASYPHPLVPTYSLPAIADETTVSKGLAQMWKIMQVYDKFQDGQLTKSDAIVPESKYLGSAKADHLAVALPFDKVGDDLIKAQMDKGRYPRAALLESMVRVIVEDLEKTAKPQ
jgi:hypothetical protein